VSRAHVVEGGTVISVIIHLPKHMHCLVIRALDLGQYPPRFELIYPATS
jgi:hypothetical protein